MEGWWNSLELHCCSVMTEMFYSVLFNTVALVAHGYKEFDMWLGQLKKWIFIFRILMNLNSYMSLMATVLNSAGLERFIREINCHYFTTLHILFCCLKCYIIFTKDIAEDWRYHLCSLFLTFFFFLILFFIYSFFGHTAQVAGS